MSIRRPESSRRMQAGTWLAGLLAALPAAAAPGDVTDLAARYRNADAQLQKHVVEDQWLDAKPDSPKLLVLRWALAGEWMAAWRDDHPQATSRDACAALATLVGKGSSCGTLAGNALLVATPGPFGNVFIVAGEGTAQRAAWNIAKQPLAQDPMGPILAAWQAANAREQTAAERSGPIAGQVGVLSADAQGRSRFFVDGIRAQAAGATVGAQTTVWRWDGKTAQPLLAHAYAVMLGQSVGTRFEHGLLEVREKREFRSFGSCGSCDGRQVDWSVRVDGAGVADQGVRSTVPELDAVDALFWRRMHAQSADDIASQSAIAQADAIVRTARADVSASDWKRFPNLGMANTLDVQVRPGGAQACVDTEAGGAFTATLRRRGDGFLIERIMPMPKGCP